MKAKHECKDNDNHIKVISVDGKIDELHFADVMKKEWLVIGYKDLKKAIKEHKKQLINK